MFIVGLRLNWTFVIENIGLEYAPEGLKVPEEKLGKFFTHFYETYYVPNKQVEYEFPGDAAVRRYHQNVVCLNLSQIWRGKC